MLNTFQAADWAVIFSTIPKKRTISWDKSLATLLPLEKKAHGNYFSCTKKPVFGKTV